MRLDQLKSGQQGKIVGVSGTGDVQRRLLEMGIHKGEIITMIKSAPLKDPLQISLGNGHIGIGRQEAALIKIELLLDSTGE
jgi:ferrous iron transport protein B